MSAKPRPAEPHLTVSPTDVVPAPDSPLQGACFPIAESLRNVLERMSDGVLVCDHDGHWLLANPAMQSALDNTSRGERLRRELQEFVAEISSDGDGLRRRIVRTREGSCLLEGGRLSGPMSPGPGFLVTLQLGVHQPLDAAHLQDRFGMSEQETRVLALLTDGHNNRQIAHALEISHHTVRHHIEHILLKLHVNSRSAAVARVLRG